MKKPLRWYREWIYELLLWIGRKAQALLLGPDDMAIGKRPAPRGFTKKCPYCTEFLNINARICVFCGAIL